eukprot:s2143_g8.t1
MLKAQKQQLKQALKEMSKNVKLQQQKKRRLMRAAHNLHDEDLEWLLRERETQRTIAAQAGNQQFQNGEQNGANAVNGNAQNADHQATAVSSGTRQDARESEDVVDGEHQD